MNIYQFIKNAHTALLIGVMYKFPNKDESDISYGLIKWVVNFFWTLLIPLIVILVVVKGVQKVITSQDAEDALNSANKLVAIYGELSEYEWRNEVTVYFRILETLKKIAQMKKSDVVAIPELADVVITLIVGSGHFCMMRQETHDEFVVRKVEEYNFEHENNCSEEDLEQVKNVFVMQFDLITKNGKGDIFKEFYLGRSFMFLKINKGNSREKPKHKELVPEGV